MLASRSRVLAVSVMATALACSRGDTPRPAPADDAAAPAQSDSRSFTGQWSLVRTPRMRTPFILDLEVDSTAAEKIYGRVTRYFAGDVGGDPSAWHDFTGDLTDSTVSISVRDRGRGDVVFLLEGSTTSPDTVLLRQFRVSGANLTRGNAEWRLVRQGG